MLYLFAGAKRKSDMRSLLEAAGWSIVEFDILRGKDHDLSVKSISDKVLSLIRAGTFAALLVSPPCDTYTRAKFSPNGPPPCRNAKFLRGFPWLTGSRLHTVRIANSLSDFAFLAAIAQVATQPGWLFLEFPEDLGAVVSGRFAGMRPASIWQMSSFEDLLQLPGVMTGALRQKDFGTAYIKPTRLVFKAPSGFTDELIFMGRPEFDNNGFYLGPVPKLPWSADTTTLARQPGETIFRTTGTAAWPAPLCAWMVKHLVHWQSLHDNGLQHGGISTSAVETAMETNTSDEGIRAAAPPADHQDTFPVTIPPEGYWIGGTGEPRSTFVLGKTKAFHDGCGLTSPSRWPKKNRVFPEGSRWNSLRSELEGLVTSKLGEQGIQRLALALACTPKGDPFCPELVEEGRDIIHRWLTRNCGGYADSRSGGDIASGQPFLLNAIHFLLKEMVDPDFAIVKTMEGGVTAGILFPLPRTPAVYEEQCRWRLKEDPLIGAELVAENYASIDKHLMAVEVLFRADEKAGLMQEYTNGQFKSTFGNCSAISSLAVLEEKGKLRVLHDGTHVTKVNHKIKGRDRQRMPGVAELHTILREARSAKVLLFSVLGDFTGAHRTIKILPAEHGYLACRLSEKTVWCNKVGTFGISSASYWWSRLAGALLRCCQGLLGSSNPLDLLLFADDINLLLDGSKERRSAVFLVFYLVLLGAPLKWTKFRGGFAVDWVGLHIALKEYAVGLSASRAQWVTLWIEGLLTAGKVGTRDMAGGLGRLNFAATALIYEKAFLGILYLWVSAILRGAADVVALPWAVRLILTWIHRRLTNGDRLQVAPHLPALVGQELFRSDAKAEKGLATIGGWECAGGIPASQARWFFVRVEESWAPWAFAKKSDPQRVIATLELLGTLLSIMLFGSHWSGALKAAGVITGATDNLGNTYAVSKLMSTKWPLTTLLLELSEQLRTRQLCLQLVWRKRDENAEADSITNEDFSGFNGARRMTVDPASLPWLVLPELMEASKLLYQGIVDERERATLLPKRPFVWKKTAANKRFRTSQPW